MTDGHGVLYRGSSLAPTRVLIQDPRPLGLPEILIEVPVPGVRLLRCRFTWAFIPERALLELRIIRKYFQSAVLGRTAAPLISQVLKSPPVSPR